MAWKWFKNYKQSGEQVIKNNKIGVKPGTNYKLNNTQKEKLKKLLKMQKSIDSIKLEYVLIAIILQVFLLKGKHQKLGWKQIIWM